MTWITMKLPGPVETRAQRNSISHYFHKLVNRQGLGNLVKNPTSAYANPAEVITNIENWRVWVQLFKESTGQMPIQENITTAFEKLINPVLKMLLGLKGNVL